MCLAGEHLTDFVFLHVLMDICPPSAPLMGYAVTAAERALIGTLHAYWGNFAWSGSPTRGPFAVPSPWPANSAASDQYLRITAEAAAVQTGFRATACDFLDRFYL